MELDYVDLMMMKMYESEEYKNSNQSKEDLVTIEEIEMMTEIQKSFVFRLVESNETYYRIFDDEYYFNFGEIVDKHRWYQMNIGKSESL